ncbi:hypothetical protein [Petrachloros mirabilis]
MKRILCATGLATVVSLFAIPAHSDTEVPWECSNYTNDAQTRCLNAFVEQQREQISKLKGQLEAQKLAVGQLKEQLNQQAAETANLQQQLLQRPATTVVPSPYSFGYTYIYPPVGLGIYLGRPWIYRPGFYGYVGPFYGTRYYDRRRHRW